MASVCCVLLDGTRPCETEAGVREAAPYATADQGAETASELVWRGAALRLTAADRGVGLWQPPWRPDAPCMPLLLPWPFTLVGVAAPCLVSALDTAGRPQPLSCRALLAWLRSLRPPDFLPPMQHAHTDAAHAQAVALLAAYKGSDKGAKKPAGGARRPAKARAKPVAKPRSAASRRAPRKKRGRAASPLVLDDSDVPESPISRADSDESELDSTDPDADIDAAEAEAPDADADGDAQDSDADDEEGEAAPDDDEANDDVGDDDEDDEEDNDDPLGSEMDDDADADSDCASDIGAGLLSDDDEPPAPARAAKPRARSHAAAAATASRAKAPSHRKKK